MTALYLATKRLSLLFFMSKNEKRSYYIIHTGFVQTFGSTTPILFPDFFLKQKLLFQDSVRTLSLDEV